MKLTICNPKHSEACYFTEHVLQHLPAAEIQLLGASSSTNTLRFLSSSANEQLTLPVHHLVDDPAVRVERVLLGAIPGMTIVHDTFLTDHGPEPILNSGFSDTVRLINGSALSFPERGTEYDREKYYAIRELSLSMLPVFTDPAMHREFLNRPEPNIAVASAYVPWPADVSAKKLPQRSLLISKSNPLRVGFSCGARIGGRSHSLFSAISTLPDPSLIQIVWMIRDDRDRTRAEKLRAEFSKVRIELISNRTPQRWLELLPTLDICVHAHFGMFEQTGPYLPLSLGAGLPCIVSEECRDWLPREIALFVRPGELEVGELREMLSEILHSGAFRNEYAKDYVREFHSPAVVQQELSVLLSTHEAKLLERLREVDNLQKRARKALVKEVAPPAEIAAVFAELGWTRPGDVA